MKKFITSFIAMAVMAIMMPLTADAQTYRTKRVYKNGRYQTVRVYKNPTYQTKRVYRNGRYRTVSVYKKPSFYRRHRNAVNIGIGTGAGALIGGIARGKKGALIGSAIGAGGSALYTYKLKKKKRRY